MCISLGTSWFFLLQQTGISVYVSAVEVCFFNCFLLIFFFPVKKQGFKVARVWY